MRTNISIDDKLMETALKVSGMHTKQEAIEAGLKLLIQLNHQSAVKNYRGKLRWAGDLDDSRRDK